MNNRTRVRWISVSILGSFVVLALVIAGAEAQATRMTNQASTDTFDNWQYAEPMPNTRSVLKAAVLSETIYAVGGYNYSMGGCVGLTEAYDAGADQWTAMANLSTERCSPGLASVAGRLYAIGGWNTAAMTAVVTIEAYDPVSDSWTDFAPMPKARNSLAAVSIEGKIYAIGGWYDWVMDDLTVYDPVSDTWTTLSPMPTPRNSLAAAVVDGLIYAIGGWDGITATTKVEVYNPATDIWQSAAEMPTPRWDPGVAAVDGKIYAFGGATGNLDEYWLKNANEEYDPKTNSWRAVAPMQLTRWGLGSAVLGGKIYAIGGVDEDGEVAANEVYTPPAASSISLPALFKPSECVCPNGGSAAAGY